LKNMFLAIRRVAALSLLLVAIAHADPLAYLRARAAKMEDKAMTEQKESMKEQKKAERANAWL